MCPTPQSLLLPRKCASSLTAQTLHSVSSGPDWHLSTAPASVPVSTAPPGPPEPTVLPECGQGAGLSAQLSKLSCLPQDSLLHLPAEIPLVDTHFPGAAPLPFYSARSPPSSGLGRCLYSPGNYLAPAHAGQVLLSHSMLAL